MARGKDLAGLAALGALGYMLSQKKDEGGDSNPTRAARPESTETRLESPEDTIKRSMAKAPVDEVDDSNYGNEGNRTPMSRVAASVARSAKAPAKSAPVDVSTSLASPASKVAPGGAGKRKAAGPQGSVSSSAEGMMNYKPRSTPAPLAPKTTQGAQPKPYMPEEPDMTYKRGGKVKKMASGGMTASKRADGIASRGKTRCKMY